jgi:hypothetical protein
MCELCARIEWSRSAGLHGGIIIGVQPFEESRLKAGVGAGKLG